jgi:hypothetical protein
VHKAQTLTYLHLSGCKVGLLMNFNGVLLKNGLHRFIARGERQHSNPASDSFGDTINAG